MTAHDHRTPTGPRPRDRGAALAELAMVIPAMLAVLLVVFDFGQGFLAYISVSNGARDGARVAMLEGVPCDSPTVKDAARDGTGSYRDDVVVPDPVASGLTCAVTVRYTYSPILPFVTSSFELPLVGPIGPLWDGTMSETAVSQVSK